MTFQCSSNPPTNSNKNGSILRTRYQDSNKAMFSMLYSARRNARNCTLEKLNSLSMNKWRRHKTYSGAGLSSTPMPKRKQTLLWDSQRGVLPREDGWLQRGVKSAIHIKLEKSSLKRGGGGTLYHVQGSPLFLSTIQKFSFTKPGDSLPCNPADQGEALKIDELPY